MLKVDSPQPPRQEEPTDIPPTPPMDDNLPPDAPMSEPDMAGGMNPEGGMAPQGGEAGAFNADFDAGVDTDENEDPRNFIQQLAGKLSQSLRKYNDGLPKPDADLNKYVAGMVNAQAVKGLSPDDVETIIERFKEDEANDGDGIPPMDGAEDPNQMPDGQQGPSPQAPQGPPQGNDGEMPTPPPQQGQGQEPAMESVRRLQSIDELFQDLTMPTDDGCPEKTNPTQKPRYRQKPFISPSFK